MERSTVVCFLLHNRGSTEAEWPVGRDNIRPRPPSSYHPRSHVIGSLLVRLSAPHLPRRGPEGNRRRPRNEGSASRRSWGSEEGRCLGSFITAPRSLPLVVPPHGRSLSPLFRRVPAPVVASPLESHASYSRSLLTPVPLTPAPRPLALVHYALSIHTPRSGPVSDRREGNRMERRKRDRRWPDRSGVRPVPFSLRLRHYEGSRATP